MAQTDRFHLPLLSTAQAQKEMTHNEALTLLDAVVQAVVVEVAPSSVPASPTTGQCWIVGAGADGDWSGQDGALAAWTTGGWRFLPPFEGMKVWSLVDSAVAQRIDAVWVIGEIRARKLIIDGTQVVGAQQSAITAPTGGAIIDAEARSALETIIVTLRTHGLSLFKNAWNLFCTTVLCGRSSVKVRSASATFRQQLADLGACTK